MPKNSENVVGITDFEVDNPSSQDKQSQIGFSEAIKAMNRRYAVVKIGGTVRIADFSGTQTTFLKKNDFLTMEENNHIYIKKDGKDKRFSTADCWLSSPSRRTYNKVIFRPTLDGVAPDEYNMWTGWNVKPKKDAGKFDLFFDHIKTNICNGDENAFKWVVGWLCDIFQNPCQKIGVAIVLRSPGEGTGKGFFANQIGHLIGRYFDTYLHSERVTGKFNDHLREKILIYMDEAIYAGDKVSRGILYGLITEPKIAYEGKFLGSEQSESYLRLIMASNHEWVAPAGPTARRFCVLDVAEHSLNNAPYFQEIKRQLESGGYEALMYYLMNEPYDREFVRIPLKTGALMDQKIAGLENEIAWFFDVMNFGNIGIEKPWKVGEKDFISTDMFYASYIKWAEMNSIKRICQRSTITRNINKSCGLNKAGIPLISRYDGAQNIYKLAALARYREAFEDKFEQPVEWAQ